MGVKDKLKGLAFNAYLGPTGQRAREAVADLRRRVQRTERVADFYYDASDPYSYLLAQAVQRMLPRYPITWRFFVVTPPAGDVDPQPVLREAYSRKDALELAQRWDVDYPGAKWADGALLKKVNSVLTKQRPFAEQLAAALEVGASMWNNDSKALLLSIGRLTNESSNNVAPVLNDNYARMRERGHYQGATIQYGAEWYWGIDRLHYLERRLQDELGTGPQPSVIALRPASARPAERLTEAGAPTPPLEMFFSFRSPYSYLALGRARALAARHGVTLQLRPVAPMVERGAKLPDVKRMYIAKDAKREADRLGIPFGRLCDPLGPGVKHCMAIAHHLAASGTGRDLDFAESAARGIWSEAMNVADPADLRTIIERAGATWAEIEPALAADAWRPAAEASAADLGAAGLWGVPSFRFGTFSTWGQDRFEVLDDRLTGHFAASVPTPAAG